MGFIIRARGVTDGFRYASPRRRMGASVDTAAIVALLRGCARHDPPARGGSSLAPCLEAAHVRGALCVPSLRLGIGSLAARPDARYGHVFVTASRERLLSRDSPDGLHYGFHPGHDPAAEFVERVAPLLEATRLNTVGVLAELAAVFNEYALHAGLGPRPVLTIALRR